MLYLYLYVLLPEVLHTVHTSCKPQNIMTEILYSTRIETVNACVFLCVCHLFLILIHLSLDKPQGSGLQVCLHPGDARHAVPGGEGAGGAPHRLRAQPQHPPLRLRDALHRVGQEARRRGGAVQAAHRPHQYGPDP